MIIIAAVIYFLALIRATLVYLYVVILQTFLLLIIPMMCVLIMFGNITKDVFSNWLKNLIANAVLPIATFTAIGLFNSVAIAILLNVFNFSFCGFCCLAIPVLDYCLIPCTQPLANSYFPSGGSGFFTPVGIIGTAFCFLLVAHTSYIFIGYIQKFVPMLFIFSPAAAGLQGSSKGGFAGNLAKNNFELFSTAMESYYSSKNTDNETSEKLKGSMNRVRRGMDDILN